MTYLTKPNFFPPFVTRPSRQRLQIRPEQRVHIDTLLIAASRLKMKLASIAGLVMVATSTHAFTCNKRGARAYVLVEAVASVFYPSLA